MRLNKYWVTVLFLYGALFSFQVNARIIESESFKELIPLFEAVPEDALVIFDIDGVLIRSSNPAYNIHQYKSQTDSLYADFAVHEKDYLIGLLALNAQPQIIETEVLSILKELHSRAITTMALTAIPSGKIGSVENMTLWRFNELQSLGITFGDSFFNNDVCVLDELPENLASKPSFYKGILTANGAFGPTSKGMVLLAFLKRIHLHPPTVVFIDDHRNHLESVQKHLYEWDPATVFTGIHYLGSHKAQSTDISEAEVIRQWKVLTDQVKRELAQ